MKTIKIFTCCFIIMILSLMTISVSAQVNADVEGTIRSTNLNPRLELFDNFVGENRIEGWLEETGDNIYLSALWNDLIFSSSQTGSEVERMRIDAQTGNVGIGLNDPLQKLHVKDGNIMVQDGAFYIFNGSDAVFMDNLAGDFVIRTPGPAGNTQFYIEDEFGHVGVNTASPQSSLHVKQVGNNDGIRIENEANTNYWTIYTDNAEDFNFGYNNVLRAYIQDGSGSFVITSDRRFKNSISAVGNVLDKVMQLKPSQYYYNSDSRMERKAWGFVAQEVETVFPELVVEKDGYKGLVYDDFAIMSIKAIQEQQDVIQAQADAIHALQDQLNQVMSRIQTLENK